MPSSSTPVIKIAIAAVKALRPGGIFAIDLLDLHFGDELVGDETRGRVGDDWAVVVKLSRPEKRIFVREITTFVLGEDGAWRQQVGERRGFLWGRHSHLTASAA